MSRFLLDTHVILWAAQSGSVCKLSAGVRDALTDAGNQLFVSPVSAYELKYKHAMGKLDAYAEIVERLPEVISRLVLTELPLTVEHAMAAGAMGWAHRDPFDRLLAAQAICEGVPIVTYDTAFAGAERLLVFW